MLASSPHRIATKLARIGLIFSVLAVSACGSDDTNPATSTGANVVDTSVVDSSGDAQAADGAAAAAGDSVGVGDVVSADAASWDAGTPDAGTLDAGTPDVGPPPVAKYVARTQSQVKALLAKNPKPLLINVHIPFGGEIGGTDLHVPYNNIAALEKALGNDKGRWAVLYCMTGPMSVAAAKALVKLGYWNIIDMPGGMQKWKSLGYPFSKTKTQK